MSDEENPIRFALAAVSDHMTKPERYDTRPEAEAALAELDDAEDFVVAEVRDAPRPTV